MSASGWRAARRARKPIRSPSSSANTPRASIIRRRSRSSPPMWMNRRSPMRATGFTRARSRRTFRPSGCAAFSFPTTAVTGCGKRSGEKVLFAAHNVLRDAPFSRLDLVSCRNLLIYLNATAQTQVFDIFHFCLVSGGLLFIGGAESDSAASALFSTVDARHRLYVRRSVPRPGWKFPVVPLRAPEIPHAPRRRGRAARALPPLTPLKMGAATEETPRRGPVRPEPARGTFRRAAPEVTRTIRAALARHRWRARHRSSLRARRPLPAISGAARSPPTFSRWSTPRSGSSSAPPSSRRAQDEGDHPRRGPGGRDRGQDGSDHRAASARSGRMVRRMNFFSSSSSANADSARAPPAPAQPDAINRDLDDRDSASQRAAQRHRRAVRSDQRRTESLQRRAPGDERGDAFRDRGTGDEQGRIAVGQRRAHHRQPRAQEQRRGIEPGQRRPQQSHGLDRHRDHLSRSPAAHPAFHPERAEDFQSHPGRHGPARSPTSRTSSPTRISSRTPSGSCATCTTIEHEVRVGEAAGT